MHSAKLILALAATLASAKSCDKDIQITAADQVLDCDDGVAEKDVKISSDLAGALNISGLKEIQGDLVIANASALISVSSSTLTAIKGSLKLDGLNLLETIQLSSLKTLNDVDIVNAYRLSTLDLGKITKAGSIHIANTFISDLSNLKLESVDSLTFNSNGQLKTFNSDDLTEIKTQFIVENNGKDMDISMKNLESAGEIQLANIKKFDVSSLEKAGAIKLNKNAELVSFKAPNLTEVTNSVTFIDNKKLTKIDFPQLTKIGDMTIQNNTAMKDLSGFPKLEYVNSAIKLYGNFDKIELPKLKAVRGTATATSTTDISDFCDYFKKAEEDNIIQGEQKCSWDNPDANKEGSEDNGETTGSGSSSGSKNGGSGDDKKDDDKDGAAGTVRASMAMFGLAIFAGVAQLL